MTPASRTLLVLGAAVAAATLWAPAHAAPPPPSDLFAFPGANASPASATSAGLALADRWLGDEPFDHATGALRSAVSASPLLLRTSRQDLRADNNDFTDTSAFFDAAGSYAAWAPSGHRWGFAIYAAQPVVRREELNFIHGEAGAPTAPFGVVSQAESRESRVGLAIAARMHGIDWGVAPEWTSHSDRFVRDELSAGGPTTGTTSWDYSGNGVGFNVSARGALPATMPGHVRVGVSARYVPELSLDGTIVSIPDGPGDALSVTRESAWEGGVSIESAVSPVFRVIVGAGGRTATKWTGFTAENGASAQVALAGEYHDAEAPWRARFGVGHDSNPGTPESSASVLGLGLGWVDHHLSYDVGVTHRGLKRGDAPVSSDDRVVGSVTDTLSPPADPDRIGPFGPPRKEITMLLIRNTFRLKYGQAKPAIAAMKEMAELAKRLGMTAPSRLLTDLTGPAYTLVLEHTHENLSQWEQEGKAMMGKPEWGAAYAKFLPFVESGSREIMNIVE